MLQFIEFKKNPYVRSDSNPGLRISVAQNGKQMYLMIASGIASELIKIGYNKMRLATDGESSYLVFSASDGAQLPVHHKNQFRWSNKSAIQQIITQLGWIMTNGEAMGAELNKSVNYNGNMRVFKVMAGKKLN